MNSSEPPFSFDPFQEWQPNRWPFYGDGADGSRQEAIKVLEGALRDRSGAIGRIIGPYKMGKSSTFNCARDKLPKKSRVLTILAYHEPQLSRRTFSNFLALQIKQFRDQYRQEVVSRDNPDLAEALESLAQVQQLINKKENPESIVQKCLDLRSRAKRRFSNLEVKYLVMIKLDDLRSSDSPPHLEALKKQLEDLEDELLDLDKKLKAFYISYKYAADGIWYRALQSLEESWRNSQLIIRVEVSEVKQDWKQVLNYLASRSIKCFHEMRRFVSLPLPDNAYLWLEERNGDFGPEKVTYREAEIWALQSKEAKALINGDHPSVKQGDFRKPRYSNQIPPETVLEQAGCHPWLLQLICRELDLYWDNELDSDITDFVKTCADGVYQQQRSCLQPLWCNVPSSDRAVMCSWVLNAQPPNLTMQKLLAKKGLAYKWPPESEQFFVPYWVEYILKREEGYLVRPRVFISYSSEDGEFAERLARDVQQADLDVWIDKWKIKPGDSIPQRIEEGLRSSDYCIVILSPDSVASPWVNIELDAALMDELSGRGITVLPVRYRAKIDDIPLLLQARLYADFTDPDRYQQELQKLLAVLRQESTRVSPPPTPPVRPSRLWEMSHAELRRLMNEKLTLKDLKGVYYDLLKREPRELGEGGSESQIIQLLIVLDRHGRMPGLIEWLSKNRPDLC